MKVVIKNNYISIKENPITRVNLIRSNTDFNSQKNHDFDNDLLQGESPLGISMLMSLMKSSTYGKVQSVLFKGVPIKWHVRTGKVVINKEQFNSDVYKELKTKGLLTKIGSFVEKHIIENEIKPSEMKLKTRKV